MEIGSNFASTVVALAIVIGVVAYNVATRVGC